MRKYKVLLDYSVSNGTDTVDFIRMGTENEWRITIGDCLHYTFKTARGHSWRIREEMLTNPENCSWFEKVEEPIIKEGERFYYIAGNGAVEKKRFGNDIWDKSRLEFGNIFPESKFTEAEVTQIAEEVKALFKSKQEEKSK